MKFDNILQRLDYFAKNKGLNDNKITKEAGLSIGSLGKSRGGKGGLNSETIEKILITYRDLSARWFLTGEGGIYETNQDNILNDVVVPYNRTCDRCKLKDELIASLNREIETLQKLIAHLDKDQGNNNPANNTKHPGI